MFTGILPGSSDICYRLLNDLLCNYACDEPDMDFILIPNRPDVAGFDDLSYLLRSVDWTADNFKQHLARLKQTDLLWLYKRNLTTINQWMAENQVDLLDMATVLYPDTEDPESHVCIAGASMGAQFDVSVYAAKIGSKKAQAV